MNALCCDVLEVVPRRRLRVLAAHLIFVPTASHIFEANDGTQVDFSPFLGKVTEVQEDVASTDPLVMMASIFNRPQSDQKLIEEGHVPRGWMYDIGGGIYLRDYRLESQLGEDGLSGGMVAAIPAEMTNELESKFGLTRTMFAGVRFKYHGDVKVGDQLRAEMGPEDISIKKSSNGSRMAISTSTKRVYVGDRLVLTQFSDMVVKEGLEPGAKDSGARKRPEPPADTIWKKSFTPTEVALFSYSAVTFNRQRIHYDSHWTEEVEGYPGLVVRQFKSITIHFTA